MLPPYNELCQVIKYWKEYILANFHEWVKELFVNY